jgi:hypothetical protein
MTAVLQPQPFRWIVDLSAHGGIQVNERASRLVEWVLAVEPRGRWTRIACAFCPYAAPSYFLDAVGVVLTGVRITVFARFDVKR